MLKLERDTHTRQVYIRTAKGEALFNGLFLTALVSAVIIHAAFFFIFRIDKGHEDYPDFILPPITVHAAPQPSEMEENYSLTEYEAHVLAKQSSYEPAPSLLAVPPISSQLTAEFIYTEMPTDEMERFNPLETEFLLKELTPIEVEIPVPRTRIKLSGPIRDMVDMEFELPAEHDTILLPVHQIKQSRYSFDVIVDSDSGKVIWYDKYQNTPREIEELLLTLSFPISHDRIAKGQLEILVTSQLEEND